MSADSIWFDIILHDIARTTCNQILSYDQALVYDQALSWDQVLACNQALAYDQTLFSTININ